MGTGLHRASGSPLRRSPSAMSAKVPGDAARDGSVPAQIEPQLADAGVRSYRAGRCRAGTEPLGVRRLDQGMAELVDDLAETLSRLLGPASPADAQRGGQCDGTGT